MKKSEPADDAGAQGVLQRAFAVLRVLSDAKGEKLRLTDIAARTGQAQATVHRVLQGLVQEGMVEQPAQSKGYQLVAEEAVHAFGKDMINETWELDLG
jgi:DNA-binding IclR family transcriptional regulator